MNDKKEYRIVPAEGGYYVEILQRICDKSYPMEQSNLMLTLDEALNFIKLIEKNY